MDNTLLSEGVEVLALYLIAAHSHVQYLIGFVLVDPSELNQNKDRTVGVPFKMQGSAW
jgi:hypothetical protein